MVNVGDWNRLNVPELYKFMAKNFRGSAYIIPNRRCSHWIDGVYAKKRPAMQNPKGTKR